MSTKCKLHSGEYIRTIGVPEGATDGMVVGELVGEDGISDGKTDGVVVGAVQYLISGKKIRNIKMKATNVTLT